MHELKRKGECMNDNAIRADFNDNRVMKISGVQRTNPLHGNRDLKRFFIFSISLIFHAVVIVITAFVFSISDNFKMKPKIPEFIEVLDYEEFIPPVEEKVQVVKKMKLEEDAMPDDPDFKEDENNAIRANPEGDENAKALSQLEGDNGTVDYMPLNKIDVVPLMPAAEIRSKMIYPPLANKQGIEGNVILELYIDNTGIIRKIIILKDPGYGFGEAALKAMEGIKCSPAKANGIPVAVKFRYPIRFTLQK